MRFTNAFSVIAAYALFATANGAVVQEDDLKVALARLEAVKDKVHNAVHARNVHARQEPATVTSDILKIVSDGTTMGADIAQLIADLQSNPQAAAQPNAATVTSDALKVSSDITTLVSDIVKLAKDAGVPSPAPPSLPF